MQSLHSLKKNHYYKGKKLCAQDFILEQKYHSDKAAIQNKLHYESGILCGLHLEKKDENILLIKKGIAQSNHGNLIVVDQDYQNHIVAIKGFDKTCKECQHLYIRYAEIEKETSYQAMSEKNDHIEYNEIKESYQIEIESMYHKPKILSYFYDNYVLFENELVIIEQRIPKVIPEQGVFNISVDVYNRKLDPKLKVGFYYRLNALALSNETDENMELKLENRVMKQYCQTFTFPFYHQENYLEACTNVAIKADKIRVCLNDDDIDSSVHYDKQFPVSEHIKEIVSNSIRERFHFDDSKIYLGSFSAVFKEKHFIINHLISQNEENKPMNERIQAIRKQVMEGYGIRETIFPEKEIKKDTLYGSVNIDEFVLQEEDTYISNWLKNPMGKGIVHIDIALKCNEEKHFMIYFGSLVNKDMIFKNIAYGVVLDEQRGCFKIILKLPRMMKFKVHDVIYYIHAVTQVANERAASHLKSLEPSLVTLKPKEPCRFIPVFDDAHYKNTVSFTAVDGGEIYENGYYVAPKESGVYHICAIDEEGHTADSYVCVKE